MSERNPAMSGLLMDDDELHRQLEEHHEMSYGWALSCCSHNPHDAEDILQTVYQKVFEGRACHDGRSAFKTWLFAVIRNTAASERRRRWIRSLRLEGYQKEHEDDFQPADEGEGMARTERVAALRTALAGLPRRQGEVLHLVFYQAFTIEGAAKVLGISTGSARTHYERGKHRLAELLKPTGLFHEP